MSTTYDQAGVFRRFVRTTAATAPISWMYARIAHRLDNVVHRITAGRTTFTAIVTGAPVVMLTTTDGAATPVLAHEAEGAERDRLWRGVLQIFPGYAVYERRAAPRRIPVLVLTPSRRRNEVAS